MANIPTKEQQEALDQRKRELDTKLNQAAVGSGGLYQKKLKEKEEREKKALAKEKERVERNSKLAELSKKVGEENLAKLPEGEKPKQTEKEGKDVEYSLTPKALEMADAFMATKGVQNMMTNPIMSSSIKTNPARKPKQEDTSEQKAEENKKESSQSKSKKRVKKDPDFTSVVPGLVRPLKFFDSVADILGKMYNFMRRKYIQDSKQYKKDKKYKRKLVAIKEKRIEELIHLFGGKYKRKIIKEKDTSFFSKLLRYAVVGGVLFFLAGKEALASIGPKIKEKMPQIPDFMSFLKSKGTSRSNEPAKNLGELIARGESGGSYDIYNTGKAGVTGPPLKLSEMTVGEVMDLQKQKKVFAAGKYQITPDTLTGGVQSLGISKSEKFSPELQEKLFSQYLIGSKHPEIQKYLNDPNPDEKTKHDFLKALSKEFAAVEDPDKPGKSYYEGKGGNKSSIKSSEVLQAAESDRLTRQTELAKKTSPKVESSVTVEQVPSIESSVTVKQVPSIESSVTVKQVPSIPKTIPPPIQSTPNKTNGQNLSMLNNVNNVYNGSTNMAITENKNNDYAPLIQKQYYSYG
jgi:hypothetical protein